MIKKDENIYFFKKNENDKIWWVASKKRRGLLAVSFDKEKIYNLFTDYPEKFSKDEKKMFDKENLYWKNYFTKKV